MGDNCYQSAFYYQQSGLGLLVLMAEYYDFLPKVWLQLLASIETYALCLMLRNYSGKNP